ncbi:MAG: phosphoribosylformylglycinamidine synthase, partial [Spirochaetaceae bacterium]|nr:phosphoribosylformylglycinamidine synthase [Spirochaetaceae bacterium]MCF7951195.1 phosphoribosylformylglycinamidine synthase [Spirochaetaceae bacterium]
LPEALEFPVLEPEPVQQVAGFRQLSRPELEQLQHSVGLAMLLPDLDLLQRYFRQEEQRDPSMAELKVLDTYWSDHCRHTTFTTIIDSVEIEAPQRQPHLAESYQLFRRFHGFGPCTLMDLALAGMRELRREGRLEDLEVSEEVNAASLHIRVDTPAGDADWLLMFKNETHNHPTEIEPYGGAATCLGGAIRDPLSGRAYVYQAMRLSGSGDPRRPLSETRRGKLPQRIITSEAARGYSSYGNQVGLATGYVRECYHPGFVAKRMEVGAVIGAVPLAQVRRERPQPGDIVLLVGGATGRDGIGGATGSSKGHTSESVREAAAEVQKGNPPEERALQRYFRRPEVAGCIKRSNDFGAGGIAVAVGELAEGLDIDLDRVPKKYAGLDGTELAISESQERMAIVADPAHRDRLIEVAARENLTATEVAVVGSHGRLRMFWQGEAIVDLSREFLDKNGAPRHAEVRISPPSDSSPPAAPANAPATGKRGWIELFRDLNCAGQQGLVEQFDSTIGARSVLLPFGGARGLTPAEAMVAKLPVPGGATSTVSFMAAGYNPDTAARSPYLGGINAVVEALCRISAAGADPSRVRLSLQEYFERLGQDPHRWGKPFAALLGAYRAQIELGTPAVGGKDSMSGSFEELSVPPTLAAFAVAAGELGNVISPEFKAPGRELLLLQVNIDSRPGAEQIVVLPALRRGLEYLHRLIREDFVAACRSIRQGGTAAAVSEMAFGNFIGARFDGELSRESRYGSFVLERKSSRPLPQPPEGVYLRRIGRTTEEPVLDGYPLDELLRAWQEPLAGVFPMQAEPGEGPVEWSTCTKRGGLHASKERSRPRSGLQHRTGGRIGMPRVLLPVFPGTNCEDESAARFQSAGAQTEVLLFRNKELAQVEESIEQLARQIRQAQILMLPGGFSAGDEPAGAGKYIAAVLRSPAVMEAVTELLERRDGLVLGICNGFQALLRTGLLPYGEYRRPSTQMPTLAPNSVGRHVSRQVKTVTLSKLSPWLMALSVGDVYTLPVSHGEGRYFSPKEEIEKLMNRGQVAFQYCDADGTPTLEFPDNPNGSMAAIEGISSPDGRVLGKMGHSERIGEGVAINVPGRKDQGLFRAGVEYFL